MKDQHEKIKGYRDLSQEEIDLMNKIKVLSEEVGVLVYSMSKGPQRTDDPDQRWVGIAKDNLQTGFMALVRSVAKPTTF